MNGGSWLILGCLLIAWLCMYGGKRPSSSGRAAMGRSVQVHGHGSDRPTIAVHEAGHAVAARKVGGKVLSATMTDHEGLVRAEVPDERAAVAFLYAGQYAAGTRRGAHGDEAAIRAELKRLPANERAAAHKAAKADARRIVSRHRGEIRRDAAVLNDRGRL